MKGGEEPADNICKLVSLKSVTKLYNMLTGYRIDDDWDIALQLQYVAKNKMNTSKYGIIKILFLIINC